VSPRTIASAKLVQDKGAPELVAAVEQGKVSVSAAAEVATAPKEEQRDIVARGEDEIIKAANRIKREKKERKQAERKAEVAAKAATVAPTSERYQLYRGHYPSRPVQSAPTGRSAGTGGITLAKPPNAARAQRKAPLSWGHRAGLWC
jgi:hypothetical protein